MRLKVSVGVEIFYLLSCPETFRKDYYYYITTILFAFLFLAKTKARKIIIIERNQFYFIREIGRLENTFCSRKAARDLPHWQFQCF